MGEDKWSNSLKCLGVNRDAEFNEIQATYRKLVLKYHPDINRSRAASGKIREIVEAYGTLVEIQREKEAHSNKSLSDLCNDPRMKRLSNDEIELRLHFSSSPKVRATAALFIGSRSGKRARSLLFKALGDTVEEVRLNALESFRKIGKPQDIFHFFPLLRYPSLRLLRAVFHAIGFILGRFLKRFLFIKLSMRERVHS